MDIDQLRTFLEVHRTRHFGRASRSLFITQSAISTRIKQLEETLGVTLFIRKRNDIQLTPAGQRFLPSAEAMLALWEEARSMAQGEKRPDPHLIIGAGATLWDHPLPEWLTGWRRAGNPVTIQGEHLDEEALARGVSNGTVDLGILLDPPKSRDFRIQELAPLELQLVASRPGLNTHAALTGGHIQLNWGRRFQQETHRAETGGIRPVLTTSHTRIAYEWLLTFGGSAHLPRQRVEADLQAGRLFAVEGAPASRHRIYAIHASQGEKQHLIASFLAHRGIPDTPDHTTT
ncbi:MAG: LysR family transcriptional regulator [Magnetococcales bacterium]|nr:LysR family transcriptional regulator [Magnetococcales bacterium]